MPPTPAPLGLLCPRAAPSRAAAIVVPARPAVAGAWVAHGSAWLPTNEGTTAATVLVADVRGFTGLSRRLGAAATAAFLNRLFGAIVPCIEAEAGSIDKFIGDAVLAVFGLQMAKGDEADRAVRAAIAIQRRVADLNRTAPHAAGTAIAVAIGIDAGEVFFGRVGAGTWVAPTVIGANVNSAFALQQACKRCHASILISAAVRRHLADRYCLRLLDAPRPHEPPLYDFGETAPVYEVLDHHSETTFPGLRAALRHYHRGLAASRAGRFAAAERAFAAALALNEHDPLCRIHAERCRRLRAAEMTDLCNATKRLGVRRRVRL